MDAFVWLLALTLRCTVVLSVALGLAWLLRRSSAAARHRLLTLTAVGLLGLPALPGVLPRLELPIGLFRCRIPGAAPRPVSALARRTEITVTTGVGYERSSTPPALLPEIAAAAAPATLTTRRNATSRAKRRSERPP